MNCPKCGKYNKDYSVFCTGCGERLQKPEISSEKIKEDVDKYSKKGSSKALVIILIICAVLLTLIIAGVIAFVMLTQSSGGLRRDIPAITTEEPTDEPTGEPTEKPTEIDTSSIQDIVGLYTSESHAAVSILDFNASNSYAETYAYNEDSSFVASGFYAPLYLVADGDYDSEKKADLMMSEMDNDAANYIIEDAGGTSAVNSRLSDMGFHDTVFERKFGDTAASNAGYENYTSAKDVSLIMNSLHNKDGHLQMNVDLEEEGIDMPYGVNYYAHRGSGIGNAYNVYVFIENNDVDYCISILTKEMDKDSAKDLISEIIDEIHHQMESIYE